jgi:hypothetical protein
MVGIGGKPSGWSGSTKPALFTQALDPKPAWDAFVGLTGGSANPPASSVPSIPLP